MARCSALPQPGPPPYSLSHNLGSNTAVTDRGGVVERTDKPITKPSVATDFSEAFRAVAREVSPAVVLIEARGPARRAGRQSGGMEGFALPPGLENDPNMQRFFEQFQEQAVPRARRRQQQNQAPREAMGSGFIIDSSGVILTNSHVVEGADEVLVRLMDGREYVATDIKTDPTSDVAVITIDADNLTPAAVGDSDATQTGDWVVAIGSPFGLETTVTAGIISAKGRSPEINKREDYLQTDAAINPGNSGGPLVNLSGQVIGINTAISSRGGGNDGVGFAIPINMAKWVADELVAHGSVQRSFLGVGIQPLSAAVAREMGVTPGAGALVNNVFADTPAAAAGLQVGDVILKVAGNDVTGPVQLQGLVEQLTAGKSFDFVVLRDGKRQPLGVTVAAMPSEYGETVVAKSAGRQAPAAENFDTLGLEVAPLTDDVRQQLGYDSDATGLVVTNVTPGRAAARAGLEAGLLIERVGKQSVSNVKDFKAAVEADSKDDHTVLLLVRTTDGSRFVTLKTN